MVTVLARSLVTVVACSVVIVLACSVVIVLACCMVTVLACYRLGEFCAARLAWRGRAVMKSKSDFLKNYLTDFYKTRTYKREYVHL